MSAGCGVLCSLCDMTGLIARQGKAPRANPPALHALWLRRLAGFCRHEDAFVLPAPLNNRFEADAGADVGTRKWHGMARRAPTRVDLASADPCASNHHVENRCCLCLLYIYYSGYKLMRQNISCQELMLVRKAVHCDSHKNVNVRTRQHVWPRTGQPSHVPRKDFLIMEVSAHCIFSQQQWSIVCCLLNCNSFSSDV